jgi:hypothetical protein
MNMIQEILNKFSPMLSKHGIKLSVEETPAVEESTKVEMMAQETLEDGTIVYTPAPEMAEGVEVFVMDADGNPTPVTDGEYKLANGTTIVVAEGKIASIAEAITEEPTVEVTIEQEVAETYSKEQVEGLLNNIISEFEAKLSAAEAKIVELSQAPAATTVKQSRQSAPAQPVDMSRMTSQQRAFAILSKFK